MNRPSQDRVFKTFVYLLYLLSINTWHYLKPQPKQVSTREVLTKAVRDEYSIESRLSEFGRPSERMRIADNLAMAQAARGIQLSGMAALQSSQLVNLMALPSFGGTTGTDCAITEEYNGTSWVSGGCLTTRRDALQSKIKIVSIDAIVHVFPFLTAANK